MELITQVSWQISRGRHLSRLGVYIFAVCFLAAMVTGPTIGLSQTGGSAGNDPIALAQSGRLDAAVQSYLAAPADTPTYYYNLGTLYLRLQNFGKAVAYLEKAQSLSPHDTDIQFNLKAAQVALGHRIGPDHLDLSSNWSETVADRVSLDEVRGAIGVFGLILVAFWTRSYRRNRRILRTLLAPSGIVGLIGFGLIVGLYFTERMALPSAVALEKATIRSGPGEKFTELGQLQPGVKIRLTGVEAPASAESGASGNSAAIWKQVRYSADGIGWTPAPSLLLLSPH